MLLGSSQFTTAWMELSSSAVPLMDLPSRSEVISLSLSPQPYLQRLTILVVRLAIQTLRVDPTGLGRFGVSRTEEDEIGRKDFTLIDSDNVANANGALRTFLETLRLLVQHFDRTIVCDSVGFVSVDILAYYALE